MSRISDFKNDYIGLEPERAEEHIELYGYNSDTKLDEKDRRYNPAKAFIKLRTFLMIAAAVLYIWHGVTADDAFTDILAGCALAILCGVFCATEIIKNTRCDEYFFRMKAHSKTEFRVVRGGELIQIRRELIVPDDILVLSAGESVPADAHLLEIHDLTVDECIFTGSKTPAKKITGADSLSEDLKKSCIYKGTKIVSGELVARVTATGVDTRYFKEFGAIKESDEYYTTMEKTVMRISDIFTASAAVMLIIGVFAFIRVSVDIPFMDTVFNTAMPSIAFAMCFIPAETASLMRLYYIKGAQKFEKQGMWVKNLNTLEYINAATCILIDKTGMVTERSMQIADRLTSNSEMMANISVLACEKNSDDPFDRAIILSATMGGSDASALMNNKLLKAFPFDENEGGSGNLWLVGGAKLLCIKGSPEKILPLCDVPIDMLYTVQNKQTAYGKQGYDVLVVAYVRLTDDMPVPNRLCEAHYSFMGLLAFENQTKDYVPAAVLNCRKTGARVIMTTGDSAETALAVASKIGLKGNTVITGDMLADDQPLDLSDVCAFARITADMKPQIIRRLQADGEVVMITGDTASDSDLLELADIGIAAAGHIAGAAFEECDVAVQSDTLETVTDILTSSRQIHLNVKRCISAAITALITMIVFALFDLAIGEGFIISPVLASLIGAVIVPAAGFMYFENTADRKDLTEPSVYIGRGKLRKRFFIRPLLQAVGLALAEIIYFLISSGAGNTNAENAGTMLELSRSGFLLVFVFGLMLTSLMNVGRHGIIDALRTKQTFAWLTAGITLAFSLVIVFVPGVNTFFGLRAPDIMSIIISLVITTVLQIPAEIIRATASKIKEQKEQEK